MFRKIWNWLTFKQKVTAFDELNEQLDKLDGKIVLLKVRLEELRRL